mmetsp:Transcript_18652/g.25879  ORF Transcript_18652/g.25879 Transcript_18652/m.25879 type:complete len:100 (+) Transcript_18652:506-805(+)
MLYNTKYRRRGECSCWKILSKRTQCKLHPSPQKFILEKIYALRQDKTILTTTLRYLLHQQPSHCGMKVLSDATVVKDNPTTTRVTRIVGDAVNTFMMIL